MKKDIDRLMRELKIDAICAQGSPSSDTTMYYLLNGVNVTGFYIKKYGERACLLHSPIEREEAKKTGLKLINNNRYDAKKIFDKYRDRIKATAHYTKMIFDDLKIKGKVAFYGNNATGFGYNYLRQLLRYNRKIEVYYESEKSLISQARATKDKEEVTRIKKVRDGVVLAFNTVLSQVKNMKIANGIIFKERNEKLLIKDLKDIIRNCLYQKGFINSAGLIVAQARDSGVPHNSGKDLEPVRIGEPIVFDIYPQELGGGYCFDFTRTICFGRAPAKLKKIYQLVSAAQDHVFEILKVGKKTTAIERALCNFFEKKGHPTLLSNPKTQVGYCHSLGHGLGLNVHESPSFGLSKTNQDRLEPGMVFTVEPGLYYPEENFGIRLEDVIYVDKKGRMINLTNYPRKLVVEM